MGLDNNKISIKDIILSLPDGILSNELVLKNVRVSYVRDDSNKLTDTVEVIRYDLVDIKNHFAVVTIKSDNKKPLITQEELEAAQDPIYVNLDLNKLEVKPYKIEYGQAYLSLTVLDGGLTLRKKRGVSNE